MVSAPVMLYIFRIARAIRQRNRTLHLCLPSAARTALSSRITSGCFVSVHVSVPLHFSAPAKCAIRETYSSRERTLLPMLYPSKLALAGPAAGSPSRSPSLQLRLRPCASYPTNRCRSHWLARTYSTNVILQIFRMTDCMMCI